MKAIIYGTMRMLTAGLTAEQWADKLHELHCHGIQHLHSSMEYDSFTLLREALQIHATRYPNERFDHIVKLAEPSFDESGFDPERFHANVQGYLVALGVERLFAIQWMWRGDLKDETNRLVGLTAQVDDIRLAFQEIIQRGFASRIYCFPYTRAFAETMLGKGIVRGLAVYQNPGEQEYRDLLDDPATGCHVAIRPLQAGKSVGKHLPEELLDQTLSLGAVEGTIVTATKPEHLQDLYDYVAARV